MLRAALSTGRPFAMSAFVSSFVPLPSAVAKRGICAYGTPPVASSVWIRMYEANARARSPVLIGFPATSTVGRSIEAGRPAFFASAAIAEGDMSGEPVICSSFRLSWTVLRPLTPITIAVTPNAIRTTAATSPPISKNLRMIFLLRSGPRSSPRLRPVCCCAQCRRVRSGAHRGGRGTRLRGFRRSPERTSVEEAALERPAHELGATGEAELAHQAGALGLGGPYGHVQLACHVAIRVAVGEQECCGLFALGELVVGHASEVATRWRSRHRQRNVVKLRIFH